MKRHPNFKKIQDVKEDINKKSKLSVQRKSDLSKLNEEIDISKKKAVDLINEINQLGIDIKRLHRKKDSLQNIKEKSEVNISDHAIVQYLTRVIGMNMEDLKAEMLNGKNPKVLANGNYPMLRSGDGSTFKIVVTDNTVVTVLT